jgi:hypothetical protein
VDFVRSLWNLHLHHRRQKVLGGPHNVAHNDIQYGPFHTLHYPDGKPATEIFWREVPYANPAPAYNITPRLQPIRATEAWVRSSIRRSKLGSFLVEWLIKYCRALDDPDLDGSFLKLWSVLELVTNTGFGGHKTTVRRAAFLFEDNAHHRAVLDYLRHCRNQMVHRSETAGEGEHLLNELRTYVEGLLVYLLNHPRLLNSLEEVAAFLDLPRAITESCGFEGRRKAAYPSV